ncbi:MAG: hypothetical protein AAB368_10035, partial [bacterium]
MTFLFHPCVMYASGEVKAGRLPLWNPHAYAGGPLLASMQPALFSPFTLPAYVLPLPISLALAAVAKLWVAGLAMYAFLRLLALRPIPSLLGAVAFMCCGFVTVWLGWSLGSSGVWLPAVFAATERLRQRGTWWNTVLLALATTACILGGHPETVLHCIVAVTAYALARASRGSPDASPSRFLFRFAAAIALAGFLTMAQTLPFLEYVLASTTYAARHRTTIIQTLAPRGLLLFLMPRYFGRSWDHTAWEPPPAHDTFSGNYNETSGTVGIALLLLVPCALLAGWRRPGVRFFAALAFLSAAIVYNNPVMPRLAASLPGLSVSVNIRLVLILDFALCVLGAIGMQELTQDQDAFRTRLAVGVSGMGAAILVVAVAAASRDYQAISAGGAWNLVVRQLSICLGLTLASTVLALRVLRSRAA